MKPITLASLAMTALLFVGCASGPRFADSGDAALKPPPGQALVFLLRTPNFVDSATSYHLGVNGQYLTTVPNGGYHVFTNAPGTMKFSSQVKLSALNAGLLTLLFNDAREIFRTEAQADTIHYLKFSFSQIEELPPAKGAEAVARCRKILPPEPVKATPSGERE